MQMGGYDVQNIRKVSRHISVAMYYKTLRDSEKGYPNLSIQVQGIWEFLESHESTFDTIESFKQKIC